MNKTKIALLVSTIGLSLASGCSIMTGAAPTSPAVTTPASQSSNQAAADQLRERQAKLDRREAELNKQEVMLKQSSPPPVTSASTDLLPPNAKAGECYARVWVEPTYKTISDTIVSKEASEKVEIVPAKYETVTEKVLVAAVSKRFETIPAVYGTDTKTVQISEAKTIWLTHLPNGKPANEQLLKAAAAGGIALDQAKPGQCFHEHYIAATYENAPEQVLVKEASTKIAVVPAKYEWAEERVLVKEASERIVQVPATYETISEQVIDKPAHTVWKKGTGPIQRIDEATGEIMCLVEVSATYKKVTRQVVKTPAGVTKEAIPAVYKTIKVQKLVTAASDVKTDIPAEYATINKRKLVTEASYVWHEIHNTDLSKESRTGNQICLTEVPAKFETKKVRVLTQAASVREIEIPAKYKDVKVTKVVSAAQEVRTPIAAESKTVTRQELLKDGYMEWRSILCETNMTRDRLSAIQRALKERGYNPGRIDGVIGSETMMAVNNFQRAQNLPVDKYLNVETVSALGVSPK